MRVIWAKNDENKFATETEAGGCSADAVARCNVAVSERDLSLLAAISVSGVDLWVKRARKGHCLCTRFLSPFVVGGACRKAADARKQFENENSVCKNSLKRRD